MRRRSFLKGGLVLSAAYPYTVSSSMTTYKTGNPIGSESPKDLYDNAQNLDILLNHPTKTEHPDRLGVPRKTWHGMEVGYESISQEALDRVSQAVASAGYQYIDTPYAGSITVDDYNQVIRAQGPAGDYEFWKLSAGTPVPYITTGAGMPEGGAFVSVGDAALRSELANQSDAESGSSLVGHRGESVSDAINKRTVYVENISELNSIPPESMVEGQEVYVKSVSRHYTWNGNDFGLSYDLFIIYGQSNAVGQATASSDSSRPADYPDNIDDSMVLYWDKRIQEIVPVTYNMIHAMHGIARGHAWAAFANRYVSVTGRGCLFLPAAQGGLEIRELAKGGTFYTALDSELSAFDLSLSAQGYVVNSRNLLFHQGETDQLNQTPRDVYQDAFSTLLDNIRTDFSVGKSFIALVGNPQNRTERTWSAIQVAQEYVCTSLPHYVLAYTKFGSFTLENGLLRDGVHATQNGYNFMGEGMADAAVDAISYDLGTSKNAQQRYGVVNAPEDQIWRQVSATFVFDGTTGEWVLQDKDNSAFRIASVGGVQALPVASPDRLRIFLTPRATAVLGITATPNVRMVDDGVQTLSADLVTNAQADIFQGSGYAIDVRIYQNISFVVNTDGNIRSYPDVSNTLPSWLNGVSSDLQADNSVVINHPACRQVPILTQLASSDFSNASFVSFGDSQRSDTVLSYKVSGGQNTACVVCLPHTKLNPLNAVDLWSFTVTGIIAEARY
ncbi:sialate O-acetylesterase [Halomonas cupida]|uniref:sialate O-acetylesterase n=1 Tax=Halomonas cupida TaxID=44933 RepID=UPI003EF98966